MIQLLLFSRALCSNIGIGVGTQGLTLARRALYQPPPRHCLFVVVVEVIARIYFSIMG
jgi:hypothetical protein